MAKRKVLDSCAFGTCSRSASRGGPGCRMCDVVAQHGVFYMCGSVRVEMSNRERDRIRAERMALAAAQAAAVHDDVRPGEAQLTKRQRKKANNAR